MLEVPEPPETTVPDLWGQAPWGSLPVAVELSPLVLGVLLALAGIFVAGVSVVLVYHWRRFPFEHDVFRWAERIYFAGTLGFLGLAVLGIMAAAAT